MAKLPLGKLKNCLVERYRKALTVAKTIAGQEIGAMGGLGNKG